MKRTLGTIAASILFAAGLVFSAVPAQAAYKTNSDTVPGGATLTANVWFETISWDTCFAWESSAILSTTPDSWIQNDTSFSTFGLGSVTIGPVSIGPGGSPGGNSISWRNSNGATGSYLGGQACATMVDLTYTGTTVATSFHYGNTRSVSTG